MVYRLVPGSREVNSDRLIEEYIVLNHSIAMPRPRGMCVVIIHQLLKS